MIASEALFWASLAAVVYTYAGYPMLLFVLASLRQTWRDVSFLLRRSDRRSAAREGFAPRVALLVAAYNEESVIASKIDNTAALNYPPDKLCLLLGLDAPSDRTAEIAQAAAYPWLRVFPFAERRGKLAVINDLAERADAEILVFSDANTLLEPAAVGNLVRHFADARVGAACGELRYVNQENQVEVASLYWRFEVMLKFLENRLGCNLGASGAVYAVRRSLFRPLRGWIIEDFQLPMEIRYEGHRVVYDPEAVGREFVAPSIKSEFNRKARIGTGGYQCLFGNVRFLNPLRGLPAFAYFSHKVVRWLAPLALLAMLVTSALLAEQPLYRGLLAGQVAFYLAAVGGYVRQSRGRSAGLLAAPYVFATLHLALLAGLLRYLTGRQTTVWKATPREAGKGVVHAEEQPHE